MAPSKFRAPGVRWPIPNVFACLAMLGFGILGWTVYTVLEEEQALNQLFNAEANSIDTHDRSRIVGQAG